MQAPARTELADGELVLRPFLLEDAPRVTGICQDPEISRWTRVPTPYREEHARTWIEQTIRDWDDHRHSAFAVTEAGEVVGAIGMRLHEDYALQASIGYWVAREARGRGIATRSLRLVSRWAIIQIGFPRVQLVTDPENVPSQRVAEAAGFQREGVLRGYTEHHGKRRDCVMYSLLVHELQERDRG